ncbi:MAG: isoaspartyl peptidase/L-asparaginase [Acidobacteriota bacterium]
MEIKPRLVVHGGAGVILRERLTREQEAEVRRALRSAVEAGRAPLERGGSALDAVQAAVQSLEDCPLFNAGRGSVFTAEGRNEMDAAIVDGASLAMGAVAAVRRIRNPVALARLVMERSPHVLLSGDGAEAFAAACGVGFEEPAYFHTDRRWRELQETLAKEGVKPPAARGTVGAVALDAMGHLAAATSTGGMTAKRYGRIGDSPVPGAGTYARDGLCAVSTTGHGEFFLRTVAAHELAALMRYRRLPLAAAARAVLRQIKALGGSGGLIALDALGSIAMPFTTPGMYRGWTGPAGRIRTAIFGRRAEGRP